MKAPLQEFLRKHPLVSATFGLMSIGANAASWLGEKAEVPAQLASAGLALVGVGYFGRWLTHVAYYVFRGSTWRLRALVLLELAVALAWAALAVLAFVAASPLLVCASCAGLFIAIALLASEVADAVENTDLETASARMEGTRLVEKIEWCMIRIKIPEAMRIFGAGAPGEASKFILAILAVLVLGMAVTVSGAYSEAGRRLGDLRDRTIPAHEGRHRTSPGAAHKPTRKAPPRSAHKREPHELPQARTTPQPAPTHEQICGYVPTGNPAPEPTSTLLRNVFLAAGEPASGCAHRPMPVGSADGTWTMGGYCNGMLISLAVAAPGGNAELLIGASAAKIGRRLARSGVLIDVSERFAVRGGDAYIVWTHGGAEVLVRPHTSFGESKEDASAETCSEVTDAAVPYVELPPELAAKWLTLARRSFTWPQLENRVGRNTTFAFRTDTRPSTLVATGRCDRTECDLTLTDGSSVGAGVTVGVAAFGGL